MIGSISRTFFLGLFFPPYIRARTKIFNNNNIMQSNRIVLLLGSSVTAAFFENLRNTNGGRTDAITKVAVRHPKVRVARLDAMDPLRLALAKQGGDRVWIVVVDDKVPTLEISHMYHGSKSRVLQLLEAPSDAEAEQIWIDQADKMVFRVELDDALWHPQRRLRRYMRPFRRARVTSKINSPASLAAYIVLHCERQFRRRGDDFTRGIDLDQPVLSQGRDRFQWAIYDTVNRLVQEGIPKAWLNASNEMMIRASTSLTSLISRDRRNVDMRRHAPNSRRMSKWTHAMFAICENQETFLASQIDPVWAGLLSFRTTVAGQLLYSQRCTAPAWALLNSADLATSFFPGAFLRDRMSVLPDGEGSLLISTDPVAVEHLRYALFATYHINEARANAERWVAWPVVHRVLERCADDVFMMKVSLSLIYHWLYQRLPHARSKICWGSVHQAYRLVDWARLLPRYDPELWKAVDSEGERNGLVGLFRCILLVDHPHRFVQGNENIPNEKERASPVQGSGAQLVKTLLFNRSSQNIEWWRAFPLMTDLKNALVTGEQMDPLRPELPEGINTFKEFFRFLHHMEVSDQEYRTILFSMQPVQDRKLPSLDIRLRHAAGQAQKSHFGLSLALALIERASSRREAFPSDMPQEVWASDGTLPVGPNLFYDQCLAVVAQYWCPDPRKIFAGEPAMTNLGDVNVLTFDGARSECLANLMRFGRESLEKIYGRLCGERLEQKKRARAEKKGQREKRPRAKKKKKTQHKRARLDN